MTCGQFWLNAFGVDRLHQWSNRGQAVWTDIETTTIAAGTTSGPTPAQTRSEVWLALIHGANGIDVLRRHLGADLPRGRHLRERDDGHGGDGAEPADQVAGARAQQRERARASSA